MSFELSDLIPWASTVLGIVAVWFRNQYKLERLMEKDDEQGRQIEALWKWKDNHESSSVAMREQFNREISELRGSTMVTNAELKQMVSVLIEIKDRLSRIENRRGDI